MLGMKSLSVSLNMVGIGSGIIKVPEDSQVITWSSVDNIKFLVH